MVAMFYDWWLCVQDQQQWTDLRSQVHHSSASFTKLKPQELFVGGFFSLVAATYGHIYKAQL